MTDADSILRSALGAAVAGRDVDVVGAPSSGRTALLAKVAGALRDEGREVLEIRGQDAHTGKRAAGEPLDGVTIMVDDWDLTDDEQRLWLRESGAVIVAARTADQPPREGAVVLHLGHMDDQALRTALVRVFAFVLDKEDARSLAVASGGAIGAAIRLVSEAMAHGALRVDSGHAILAGTWPGVDDSVERTATRRR